jgi:hypothetical protein
VIPVRQAGQEDLLEIFIVDTQLESSQPTNPARTAVVALSRWLAKAKKSANRAEVAHVIDPMSEDFASSQFAFQPLQSVTDSRIAASEVLGGLAHGSH